jgi:hypothetical protein
MNQRVRRLDLLISELREEVLLMDSNYKGKRWESDFADACRERGLCVEEPRGREDLVVSGLRVQCKHIDQSRNGIIDISNRVPVKKNGGMRGYTASECDVFAIKHFGDLFLVPAAALCDESGLIRRHVTPLSLRRFLNHWEVFETGYEPPRVAMQNRLFEDDEP